MELFESVVAPGFLKEIEEKCPFQYGTPPPMDEDPEHIPDDDRIAVQVMQENDGGKLGKNLVKGIPGASNTWQTAFPPMDYKEAQEDSKHPPAGGNKDSERIIVEGEGCYYTVAAHHLIPGNASLYNSESKIKQYMIKNEPVEVKSRKGSKTFKIQEHIGYNVNGAHNGVWLPGNYAMNRPRVVERNKKDGTSEIEWTAHEAHWQRAYVVAAVKHKKAQFHDTHPKYSEAVLKCLKKMADALNAHQADCDLDPCNCKKPEIAPPYMLIAQLNKLSKWLRGSVTASNPLDWELPFVTSESWRKELTDPKFKKTYLEEWYG